jgi:hypothetical protein
MHYALLGRTGFLVPRLAFGAMTFTAGNKDIGAVFKVGAKLAAGSPKHCWEPSRGPVAKLSLVRKSDTARAGR